MLCSDNRSKPFKIDLGVNGEQDARTRVAAADLKMLVKNLVENAIRYTPLGGQVDVSVRSAGGKVSLIVENTGPGIAEHERQRVFDPFYRVLGLGQGQGQDGSGLGLSIVKAIADRVGAEVTLGAAALRPSASELRVQVKFDATES